MTAKHRHEWTLLWGVFGPYGDQKAHYHQCFTCDAMLVGRGTVCTTKRKAHKIVHFDEGDET